MEPIGGGGSSSSNKVAGYYRNLPPEQLDILLAVLGIVGIEFYSEGPKNL